MSVGVATLVHGRREHLAGQHALLRRQHDGPYVVVAMDDPGTAAWCRTLPAPPHVVELASDPLGLPLAAARNLAARTLQELGADTLVLLDVDCLPGPGLVHAYADAVAERPDVVWSGPVTYLPPPPPGGYPVDDLTSLDAPHAARPAPAPGEVRLGGDPDLFWSLSFALHADAWRRAGGFDEAYVGYGGEDTDFGQRVVRAGLDLGWVGAARAYHQHHPTTSPPVQHVADVVRNGRLFRDRWGRWPMTGWLDAFEERGLVRRDGDDYVVVQPAPA
jgi:GT2 family glycosyltransferase